MLTSMQPIRDRRDRVVGYAVSTCPSSRYAGAIDADEESQQLVDMVSALSRLAGRSLVVPVTPAIVRDGALARFASVTSLAGPSPVALASRLGTATFPRSCNPVTARLPSRSPIQHVLVCAIPAHLRW